MKMVATNHPKRQEGDVFECEDIIALKLIEIGRAKQFEEKEEVTEKIIKQPKTRKK